MLMLLVSSGVCVNLVFVVSDTRGNNLCSDGGGGSGDDDSNEMIK